MRIGMTGQMMGGGWKNPYVTSGLLAMWDGIANTKSGKHNESTIVWADMSGNGYDLQNNGSDYSWESDHLVVNNGNAFNSTKAIEVNGSFTLEILTEPLGSAFFAPFFIDELQHNIGYNICLDLGLVLASRATYFSYPQFGKWQSGVGGDPSSSWGSAVRYYLAYDADNTIIKIKCTRGTISNRGVSISYAFTGANNLIHIGSPKNTSDSNFNLYSVRLYDKFLSDAELAVNAAADTNRFWS